MPNPVFRALFSVLPGPHVLDMARQLSQAGWQIIATPDARDQLAASKIPVVSVADFNGVAEPYAFPPTLHAKMERALTEDCEYRIDLVYDLPYPLSQGNDVGGHTLLALAAKGNRIPVATESDMQEVVCILAAGKTLPDKRRRELVDKANAMAARHYIRLAAFGRPRRYWGTIQAYTRELQNGENPYQVPTFLADAESEDPLALPRFRQVTGSPPCFTNLADLDAILETLCRLTAAALPVFGSLFVVVAAKHGNACGIGVSQANPVEAIERALWGNPQAIWGGEVIMNFPLTQPGAEALAVSTVRAGRYGSGYWMLDVVAAPEMRPEAVAVLGKNPNRKLFVNPYLAEPKPQAALFARQIRGGALVQPPADYLIDFEHLVWTGEGVSQAQQLDLLIAWAAAYTGSVGGNEVALAKNGQLLVMGGGPATIQAIESAVHRAHCIGNSLAGAAFAADAFFPFTDAPDILCDAGAACGVVPAGGRNHDKVAANFVARGVRVGFIPEDKSGFCRH